MVYVTGDMHGAEERLYDKEWRKLKKGDTLIVCGDFGYLWSGGKQEREYIKYLGTRRFTVAFLDGTHDNLDRINACRTTFWKGGMVHRISGNLVHLMRGQVFDIENLKIFTFGGGESNDKDMRLSHNLWWRDEMPTPLEMSQAAKQLDTLNCSVDYILTHEPPSLVKSAMLLRRSLPESVNKLNGFFKEIDEACSYKHWFFGSMHEDRLVTPKHTCVFRKILPINYSEI